jgi:predicted solute-binding protein
LNARPLCHGLTGVTLAPPDPLATALHAGHLEAALVPVLEVLATPGYRLVRGVGISCRGPVRSVIVAPDPAGEPVRTVAPDPDSRTSNALARLLLPSAVRWVPAGATADARVLIGDPALAYRREHPSDPVLDLGEAWVTTRHLPFVFAVWAVRPGVPEAEGLADTLRQACAEGRRHLREYCRDDDEGDYLTRCIVHELDDAAEEGLRQFQQELVASGSLDRAVDLVWI